jgi:hypothetical protein
MADTRLTGTSRATIIGISNISIGGITTTQTQTGTSRLQARTSKTLAGTTNLLRRSLQTMSGTANIFNISARQTITGTANIIVPTTNYYIDPIAGDDNNDGISMITPWRTNSPLHTQVLHNGDKIFVATRQTTGEFPMSLGSSRLASTSVVYVLNWTYTTT